MINIITTGGTIEGFEYDKPNLAPNISPMPVANFLKGIKNLPEYQINIALLKDSRFINDKDRAHIVAKIDKTDYTKILVTHGTLTMIETAQYIGKLNLAKTVVLTGAFILGTDTKTDAIDNLSFALKNIINLGKGVFIAMHNEIFPWYAVRKNIEKNRFEKI